MWKAVLVGVLVGGVCRADALVVTRAMTASTIAEVFVEGETVRVEIEVAVGDLHAFRDLLPAELRASIPDEPLVEPWGILADGVELVPAPPRTQPRTRVARDEVTGEPIGDAGQPVLFVELRYALPTDAAALTLRPPRGQTGAAATIGFVLYHESLPVTDFRYLGRPETLDLDRRDPWYTRFRNRNLRRQFDAPLNVFLYVEPFEVRVEVIARPRDLEAWADLGLGDSLTIPVEAQAELERRAVELVHGAAGLRVDGRPAELSLDRVHFIRRSLRQTGVIDPREELPAVSATLGLIFSHPRAGSLPDEAELRWSLFSERIAEVPSVATDEAGGLPWRLTSDEPVLRWENFLTDPRSTQPVELAPPRPARGLPLASLVLGAAGVVALARRRAGVGVVLLLVAAAAAPFLRVGGGSASSPGGDEAELLVAGLLQNVYRSFDQREEERIYDALAGSVGGALLSELYVETRRGLELANQGGALAKVAEVELEECASEPRAAGLAARCTWTVAGAVGHWGHVHTRRNRYRAELDIQPVGGVWKIIGLELASEERLQPGAP